MKDEKPLELSKEKMYLVNGRKGQYELTTLNKMECFFMDDTLQYEYFENPEITEVQEN